MTVVAVVAVWLAFGLGVALVMARRGHQPLRWIGLAFLGPILLFVADSSGEQRTDATDPETLSLGHRGPGPIDVLVGLDGSPESVAAVDEVLGLLGHSMGQLTLAAVVDYETAQYADTSKAPLRQAENLLEGEADRLRHQHGVDPATVVLVGEPAQELLDFAHSTGLQLVAVGSRGSGAARRVLGSVATRLAKDADVPVLLTRA